MLRSTTRRSWSERHRPSPLPGCRCRRSSRRSSAQSKWRAAKRSSWSSVDPIARSLGREPVLDDGSEIGELRQRGIREQATLSRGPTLVFSPIRGLLSPRAPRSSPGLGSQYAGRARCRPSGVGPCFTTNERQAYGPKFRAFLDAVAADLGVTEELGAAREALSATRGGPGAIVAVATRGRST